MPDYASLHAAGHLALDGPLALDVHGPINLGAVLTIATGRSLTGTFDDLPDGAILRAGGFQFRVSYRSNAVTLTTVAEATVGGTVPATLSLTLGTPASFGAFTPGIAKDYSAQTTANVISTAGDAALSYSSVSPGGLTTASLAGHLTNGAFALPSPLVVELSKAAWTGPVSNDSVTIAFKQHIDADDALRTGAYSKTLTFTLSTTTP